MTQPSSFDPTKDKSLEDHFREARERIHKHKDDYIEEINRPANQLRLVAAEIIHKLWVAGEITQLELLEVQAKKSIQIPYAGIKTPIK